MSNKAVIIVVVVLVVLGVLGYMGRHQIKSMLGMAPAAPTETASSQVPAPTSGSEATTASPEASSSGMVVTGSEFAFSPSTLTAKAGEPVTITFKNGGKYPHNFTIKELNVASKTIGGGQSDTVTFTPTKAGTYTYYCGVDGHADKGMKGTLTVQ